MPLLNIIPASDFVRAPNNRSTDNETLTVVRKIIDDVREQGETAIRKYARQFGERTDDQPLWIGPDELKAAVDQIDPDQRSLLERTAARIESFAKAQLGCMSPLTCAVPGGTAGHTLEPIERVGCYAPAGRFPLPSTVLMTAITARVAGCRTIVVATPNPNPIMLAAAAIAGADEVLAVGGAQAIATLAYGTECRQSSDLIVGPGSRWVTAAKQIVSADVGIDMLAGPSELAIIADRFADPGRIAADLIAQAEHDVDARVCLITDHLTLAEAVNVELEKQLETLPTSGTATTSLNRGVVVLVDSIDSEIKSPIEYCDAGTRRPSHSLSAVEIANEIAPEHLELHCQNPQIVANQIHHAGCLFIGQESAEVFGDYGIGPNHTLPTAGTARWSAGLNVFTFLRLRTWLKIEAPPRSLIEDSVRLAELEGLIGHQRAAQQRRPSAG